VTDVRKVRYCKMLLAIPDDFEEPPDGRPAYPDEDEPLPRSVLKP
jgi:hypothetical protein